jgi:hypothetical protein
MFSSARTRGDTLVLETTLAPPPITLRATLPAEDMGPCVGDFFPNGEVDATAVAVAPGDAEENAEEEDTRRLRAAAAAEAEALPLVEATPAPPRAEGEEEEDAYDPDVKRARVGEERLAAALAGLCGVSWGLGVVDDDDGANDIEVKLQC